MDDQEMIIVSKRDYLSAKAGHQVWRGLCLLVCCTTAVALIFCGSVLYEREQEIKQSTHRVLLSP